MIRPLPQFDDNTWLLLLNPVSGRGGGLRQRARIDAALFIRPAITIMKRIGARSPVCIANNNWRRP